MPHTSFVVAVISPENEILEAVTEALDSRPDVRGVWTLSDYPAPGQLARIHDAEGACVVVLDFGDPLRARGVASQIDRGFPMATTVAINLSRKPEDLMEFMQLGIRDVLAMPATAQEIAGVCDRAARRLRRDDNAPGGGSIYAFLPARPGSGTTTIAAHSAAAAARLGNQKSLLIDFDLHLGMTSFMFKLHGEQSVLDALTYSNQLDDTLWGRMLCRRGDLDILGSAPFEYGRPQPEGRAGAVLDFARQRYSTICVDLLGDLREHELQAIERAHEIFLVSTPDLGSLHMAKRKAQTLRALDVHLRVSVILNRASDRGAMPVKHVEEILELPVRFTVPSAEKEITAALRDAVAIDGRSDIAQRMEDIGRRMIPGTEAAEPKTNRRFLEFFSVTPIRDKAGWRR